MTVRVGHARRGPRPDGSERHSEGGAIVIEMAMVAVFMVTLLAMSFDFGMAWRSVLAANEGARAGARVGSAVGKANTADRDLLLSMRSTMDASGLLPNVERVVLFDAATTDGKVPASCVTGTTNGDCDILTGAQFRALTDSAPIDSDGCITSSSRKTFCPTSRVDIPLNADYLGVYIKVKYDFMFPIHRRTMTIERTAVMRIEP